MLTNDEAPEGDLEQPDDQPAPEDPARRWWRRPAVLAAAAVLGVIGLLYAVDLVLSAGNVPRGVVVAGVDVGGLDRDEAEQVLREAIGPRLSEPASVRAADAETVVRPADVAVDWPATLDGAGSQSLNPISRLTSLWSERRVGVVARGDDPVIREQLAAFAKKVERAPIEGTIRFDGTTPVAVDPVAGRQLDLDGAIKAVVAQWANGQQIALPVREQPVVTTVDGVRAELDRIAKPAVSGPVTIGADGKEALLRPEIIAGALSFAPGDGGGLAARLDVQKLRDALGPELAATERAGTDARLSFDGGTPVVRPAVNGRKIDWETLAARLPEVVGRTDNRVLAAPLKEEPAAVTTDTVNQLGIKEVVGEFTTRGFARDSGVNIRVVAEKVHGAVVKPGETFSLNGFTGPRGVPQGYVEAGVIEDGVPARAVGGGISQFATTLYNAAYFAAMVDVDHKEHSFYISRYPAAREATVFQNPDGSSVIDLKFRNDTPNAVAIQTVWTPETITIRLWGTKSVTVESITGPRTGFTSPGTQTKAPGERCSPSRGSTGFSTSDTRVIRDLSGKELSRATRDVVYNPQPRVICSSERDR